MKRAIFAIAFAAVACGSSQPSAVTIAGAECVSHRTALELACVDANATKAAIDTCVQSVRARIECVAKDAGVE